MLKVLNGGIETLVEDPPGRLGYLSKGMAPSGAMDNLALSFANLLVGNSLTEAGLEITGGYFEVEIGIKTIISITGSNMKPTINGKDVQMYEAIEVKSDDVLRFGHFGDTGFRSYIGIAGGIDVPDYLGSKSTCLFGNYGGFKGRKLQRGDILNFGKHSQNVENLIGKKINRRNIPAYTNEWEIKVMCGPNTCPDYITLEGMSYLFDNSFKIQLSSNRSAYRLEEIQINNFFARKDGGEGGAHPSNIIDHAYGMPGALNICGNTPVLLAVDGPTLGGYICVFTIIKSDLWKLGQGTPGRDYIKFINLSRQEAVEEWRKFKSLFLENSFE